MKKLFFTALVMISAYQVGFAQGFEAYGGWYCEYYSSGNVCIIINCTSAVVPDSSGHISMPYEVQNDDDPFGPVRTVTQLGNGTSTILNNVDTFFSVGTSTYAASIQPYAFANLQYLTTVVINGSPDVKNNAFSNDPNLTSVTYASGSGDIGDSAFEGCTKLKNVGLKDGVTKIGKRAFANCKSLRSLTIPKTVVSIAPDAFVGSGIKYVVMQRGGAPINSFPKGVYVTVKQLPYPKK